MLTYSFSERKGESLYEYLYSRIKEDILSGRLKAGEKLPSKRSLAENLSISTITVETAYSQLVAEGYIYSRARSGFFVAEIGERLSAATGKKSTVISEICTEEGRYVADLTANYTAKESFPFLTWSRLMRETLSEQCEELLISSPSQGIYELRKAIADYLFQFRGISVSPDRIIVGAGTEYLYGIIIQLLGRDKRYALEDPGYGKIGRIYSANGAPGVHIPYEKDCVDLDALYKSGADVLHISPSHHFPTGGVTPIGKRYELLSWAKKINGYIIEDDYDSEFRLSGRPVPPLQSIDSEGRVIYINTFSKSLTPTIRISYAVLPCELSEKYRRELGFYSCTVSTFEQTTLARFIERGCFEKHLNRMRTLYRARRDALLQCIKKHPHYDRVKIKEADSGLHFILEIATDLSDSELKIRAKEKGIKISCLSDYYYGEKADSQHKIVINYSSLSEKNTEEAVERLFEII
ncbi:MAG: PLP-dependent aminotransferase family protein [Clostridia bacterium]|nr:PLP-dependent aminotransferase family protein [Clostridia bacterium]